MAVRTLFIGTGNFAATILESMASSDLVEIVGVITQPDKPAGRKQELKPSPVKELVSHISPDIRVYQPEKLRMEAQSILDETTPELIIVAAYGQIIPDEMLAYPKYKCLNIHGSLLPKWRGAVPVHMAILHGDSETGVTIQRMVKEMDAGPIIATHKLIVEPEETTESMLRKMADVSASLFLNTLPQWCEGKLAEQPQDESHATFCYQSDIDKEKAEIKFDTPANVAERMVRAFYPWPIAWIQQTFKADNLRIKIFKSRIAEDIQVKENEMKIVKDKQRLLLVLQDGTLELLELQLEGKQRREAKDYLFLAN